MTRRLLAVVSLCLFTQTAALTPWVHACCMESGAMSAHAGHGAEGHAEGVGGAHAHALHAASADASREGAGESTPSPHPVDAVSGHHPDGAPVPHSHGEASGAAEDGSGSSGACCCGACDCCLGGAGAPVVVASVPGSGGAVPQTVAAGHPADIRVANRDLLLPYPNGPPETPVHLT